MRVWMLAILVGCGGATLEDDDDGGGLIFPGETDEPGDGLSVEIETTMGTLVVALDAAAAPITVENFLAYVDDGFYDGADGMGATVFHRVIDGFVVQGGGFTEGGGKKATDAAIVLESDNGRSNRAGTIAMARTDSPDSATSQFYFNLVDNDFLDYTDASNPGYAVFGELVEGAEVLSALGAVATGSGDQPTTDVVITRCERR
ncbi:MAG: peptidylprolyl isomerase [Myxococcota bacterium]|nr:peptidylprolyl isomerase [Myxococcota bacterium]